VSGSRKAQLESKLQQDSKLFSAPVQERQPIASGLKHLRCQSLDHLAHPPSSTLHMPRNTRELM